MSIIASFQTRLVGQTGSGIWVGASFQKCPSCGSVRVRTPPRGSGRVKSKELVTVFTFYAVQSSVRSVFRNTLIRLVVSRAGVKCEVRGGKMRGTGARYQWVICEAGMCEAQ